MTSRRFDPQPDSNRHIHASIARLVAVAAVVTLLVACGQSLPPRTDEPSDTAIFADGPPPPHVPCEHRDALRKPFFGDTQSSTKAKSVIQAT